MKLRLFLTVLATTAIALPLGLSADPFSLDAPAQIKLASLPAPSFAEVQPQMSVIPEGKLQQMLGIPAKQNPGLKFAGRCGSSNYYCDSPGFTYCCGNSSDGFYCAADVNGC